MKGSQFERDICTKLSLWWTYGTREDVFWRSTTSGGRSTTRAKVGKRTAGSYGDIAAIDPIGAPLLDLITFELKRGYSRYSPMDLIENPSPSIWEEFIGQARDSHEAAGSFSWAVIAKRDRKHTMIWMPHELHCGLAIPQSTYIEITKPSGIVVGFILKEWLTKVSPSQIMWLNKKV